MTETTLALCKSAFPGLLMWLSGLCLSNQALDKPHVDLSKTGTILQQVVSIPMDERYRFQLRFVFQNRELAAQSAISGQAPGAHHQACKDEARYATLSEAEKRETGAALDMEVVVASLDGKTLHSHRFQSRCVDSSGDLTKTRQFGYIDFTKGKYQLTIINHVPVPQEVGTEAALMLTGAGAGYP
ncbi:hypothetical protein [Chitinivorax sp. B]|uniref:hypothetical protein n=1 Tax=Chitinivorax sp. B TaxID=2502235 RepID=UPI0010F69758|nr:hypothetical protein [Chitinivorax sp. B]